MDSSARKQGSVTRLLARHASGDEAAMGELLQVIYGELKGLAQHYMGRERAGNTLQPTALVNEAFVRLLALDEISWENRAHFLGAAASTMRRVLIDQARARNAKRRGESPLRVELDEGHAAVAAPLEGLLALDEALKGLAAQDERLCRVVECRFFAGMSVEETAAVLGVSEATIKRDWSLARAWLQRELEDSSTT